jgi:hypothetical protein
MTLKMKIIIPVLALMLSAAGVAQFSGWPKARLTVHVVGEDGTAIQGAKLIFGFSTKMDYAARDLVEGLTDSSGNFTAEGYTGGRLDVQISKDGYYEGWSNNPIYQKDDGLGHWLPWDQTFTTILRKIGKPIPMYVRRFGGAIPSAINEPCGFDVEEGDWVAPYGKGKVADFIMTFTYLKYTDYNNNEATATITFSNDGDGIQEVHLPKEFSNSRFTWPREAPETDYQPKFDMHHLWSMSGHDTVMTDTVKGVEGYFFRVRTVKQGNQIVSALYGKITGGIGIGPNEGKNGYTGFTYYLNPTVNDRNMEWDPKKNLAPTPKDVSQQVRDP